jgi:GT2 family glycosyltransferase
MIRVALGIPTINRSDLLLEALETYDKTWIDRHIYIVDNGDQDIPSKNPWVKIHRPGVNLGVSASWNWVLKKAFENGYTHVAILNDDIVWDQSIRKIESFIQKNPAGFYSFGGTWCCFVLSYETFLTVGGFDEGFYPAYFEDNDYCYRCRLAAIPRVIDPIFSPTVYRNSMTIEKDSNLNQNFDRNKKLFINKWGGEPGQEKYLFPYNLTQ